MSELLADAKSERYGACDNATVVRIFVDLTVAHTLKSTSAGKSGAESTDSGEHI